MSKSSENGLVIFPNGKHMPLVYKDKLFVKVNMSTLKRVLYTVQVTIILR